MRMMVNFLKKMNLQRAGSVSFSGSYNE